MSQIVWTQAAIADLNSPGSLQIGKYNVNIGEGKYLHTADKIYQGADAEAIREIIQELLSSKKAVAVKYIPHQGVSHFVGRSQSRRGVSSDGSTTRGYHFGFASSIQASIY
jgi:Effector-associated domain 10